MNQLYTSESVTEGHPDKVCDQISDSIVDAIIALDPQARIACETCVKTDFVLVMGEISTTAQIDIEQTVRNTIREIGYTKEGLGFDADTCEIIVKLEQQSPDIAMGVDRALEIKEGIQVFGGKESEAAENLQNGAGDQGMMFGYATDETAEYMPASLVYAHKITRKLAELRKKKVLPYLRPDGKAQVTVSYGSNGRPDMITAVVISAQHDPDVSMETLRRDIQERVIHEVLPKELMSDMTRIYINPTGRFVTGGPMGDSGLTGRKIIVDTYGGIAHHGGGAFSGKDCTKVDRSAAYYARYAAKNIVAAGLAQRCEVQVSYAIGVAEPTSVDIETFGTGKISEEKLKEAVKNVFDFRPGSIVEQLKLRRPVYKQTASYGHFGRDDLDLTWEKLDKGRDLVKYLSEHDGFDQKIIA